MNAFESQRCLTRVMTDDDRGVEIAQLQSVMHRIQSSLRDIPPAQREYIANALLNLAVSFLKPTPARELCGAESRTRLGVRTLSADRRDR